MLTWYSHILQELTVQSYIPNDTCIIGDEDSNGPVPDEESEILSEGPETGHGPSMLLLTGPNYSGKSVYMKQVRNLVGRNCRTDEIYSVGRGDRIPSANRQVC